MPEKQTEKLNSSIQLLPDVAIETSTAHVSGALQAVGMSNVEVPILLRDAQGAIYRLPARADAYVNLSNSEARGIHMSRLFKEAQDGLTQHELTLPLLGDIIAGFLESHRGLSTKASLNVAFEALLERRALKSANIGWRTYPVKLRAELDLAQAPRYFIEVLVTYSSTCPASAALARQLIQQNFQRQFTESLVESGEVYEWLGSNEGINATPHSQRSFARVSIETEPSFQFGALIDLIEEALQTPVQTIVKREDEQEFALRNGQNLMFCEDAARRVQNVLQSMTSVLDFTGEFRHVESLHPHDAVAKIAKKSAIKS